MKVMVGFFGVAVGCVNVAPLCLQRLMAEEDLDGGRVSAGLGQVGSKAVTQAVGAGRDVNLELFAIPLDAFLEVVR